MLNIKQLLSNEDWSEVYVQNDYNVSYNIFLNMLSTIMNAVAHLKRSKCLNKWITDDIRNKCKVKRQLYKGVLRRQISKEVYNVFVNI